MASEMLIDRTAQVPCNRNGHLAKKHKSAMEKPHLNVLRPTPFPVCNHMRQTMPWHWSLKGKAQECVGKAVIKMCYALHHALYDITNAGQCHCNGHLEENHKSAMREP